MTEEAIHIRCITCNKVIGHMWNTYNQLLSEGKTIKEALNYLGLKRICCKTRMMNPFKVITKSERQTDPGDPTKLMESTYAQLSVASSDEAPAQGALSSMKKITGLTIVPEVKTDITLPELPGLPALPQVETTGKVAGKDPAKINRTYEAW